MLLDNISDFLNDCGYDLEQEIIRISGVINVNAFSTVKSEFQGRDCVRIVQCIYPWASLLAHSCVPNACWSIDNTKELRISIRAATTIKKGEIITIAYNLPETMSGTLHRLISTEDVAHFLCRCKRCSDKTELGTFASAIKCFDCENGYLLPESPTTPDSEWECCGCDSLQAVPKIVLFLNNIEETYENITRRQYSRDIEVKKLELLLRQTGDLLHENHYILQEFRMRIINLQIHSLDHVNETDLERFINHCKFMLKIADVLMPGFSKTRALLQFFLSQGLLRKVSRKTQDPEENEKEIADLYKEIHYLQTRALLYFNNQHSFSLRSEAESNQFAVCIKRQLKNLESYIN
ncbi:Protein msta, isoform A [Orchesella cincta]|uniref:Protein msta, isoform A n=1 Tax=Orchesella cincta TaxID=48709 RepID=A0A1D2ME88_ORCCI|nr:Protein msta, isoform A [Orchesella cincta]